MLTKIHFQDKGQDFTEWTVNDEGVVVDCQPFQASVWVGLKIYNWPCKVGQKPYFRVPGHGKQKLNYKITKIESVDEPEPTAQPDTDPGTER